MSTRLHARRPFRPMPAPQRRRRLLPGVVVTGIVLAATYGLLLLAVAYSLRTLP